MMRQADYPGVRSQLRGAGPLIWLVALGLFVITSVELGKAMGGVPEYLDLIATTVSGIPLPFLFSLEEPLTWAFNALAATVFGPIIILWQRVSPSTGGAE
mgnify:CR=1 FL=1|jgi:hypothetical protein